MRTLYIAGDDEPIATRGNDVMVFTVVYYYLCDGGPIMSELSAPDQQAQAQQEQQDNQRLGISS